MAADLIENVSDTAFWVAHYRAVETKRSDALFRDPLAGVLAGERGEEIARATPSAYWLAWSVVIRTRIIDDFILWAIAHGADTVLNLGAGLDTRPYRMNLPESLVWIEADYPHVIEFKEERLVGEKPRCRLERMKVDLSNATERRRMLVDVDARAKKVVVLTEGLLPYLSEEQVASLANDLKAQQHTRYWIAEYNDPVILKYGNRGPMRRLMRNTPFKFAPKDWFGFFGAHGWRAQETRYSMEEADRLHRPVDLPPIWRALFKVVQALSSPKRREIARRRMGWVLLERTDDGRTA